MKGGGESAIKTRTPHTSLIDLIAFVAYTIVRIGNDGKQIRIGL